VTYPDQRTRTYHWNEAGNLNGVPPYGSALLTGITDEVGQRVSTFTYNGRNAKSTERAGGTLKYQFSQFQPEYTTVIDPLGTSRTYKFAGYGGLTRLWNVMTWCPTCLQYATYDTHGNQTAVADFKNNATCFAYDLTRNLETKRVEGVSGTGSCPAALTSPSAGARVISTQWHPDWRLETKIAEPNKLTTVVYNGQGATCAPSTVLVDGKPPAVVCSRTEQATTDASGALGFAAGLTGTARTWSYTYTTYGRVLSATDPNGKTTTTTYYPDDDPEMGRRGNVATVTNPAGHLTRYSAYNLHGQPTQIVDPNGLTTDLTYDLRLRLTSRKTGNELTTFTYDPRGLLTKVTLPDAATVTYTYDAAHRLTQLADQRGNKITYTLDTMGNRISEKATDASGSLVRNIQRSIDALNRVQQMSGVQ
jgi:YD repeat-containing protein